MKIFKSKKRLHAVYPMSSYQDNDRSTIRKHILMSVAGRLNLIDEDMCDEYSTMYFVCTWDSLQQAEEEIAKTYDVDDPIYAPMPEMNKLLKKVKTI